MSANSTDATLALGAMITGVSAIPVAAFVNWGLGLVLLAISVFLIFMTNK